MPGYGMMFEKGGGSLPWSWAEGVLSKAHNYWLATSRPDGRPHVMPVWGVWLDDVFCFSTGRQSRKARNLAVNPGCVVCPEGAGEAVVLEGEAREFKRSALLRWFIVAYWEKYKWKIEESNGPFYAVRPRVVFGLVENPGEHRGNPTRWQFAYRR